MGDWDLSVLAWKEVLKELQKVNMFRGIYDARNGHREFMYGIQTVMEYIADKARDDKADDMFIKNMTACEEKISKGEAS